MFEAQNKNYQLFLGHDILWELDLQIRRHWHGQRTYFFPGGALFMGWNIKASKNQWINHEWIK